MEVLAFIALFFTLETSQPTEKETGKPNASEKEEKHEPCTKQQEIKRENTFCFYMK